MADQELIEKIYEGDQRAFQDFVEKYQQLVYKVSYGVLHNKEDAEDIAQDVFIEIYKSISEFRKEAKISTWLYRITLNKSLNLLKKNKRKYGLLKPENIADKTARINTTANEENMAEVELKIERDEQQKIVHTFLKKLPKNQKIAFTLSKYEGLSYKEISDIMDVSLSAVESLIHRAKKSLTKNILDIYKKYNL